MEREEQFDTFYRATRQRVTLQVFALTGDLRAAQSAVRDAYVAAWQHWRKVSSLDDPQDWVRPRAWKLAQRRHTARIWHRNKAMSERDKAILDAIAKLPLAQRKMLLLTQLASVSLDQAARELRATRQIAEQKLQSATANFSANLDVDSTSVRAHLESLGGAAAEATLPRTSIIRRAGRKRRQSHTLLGVGAAVIVAVASGAFAYDSGDVQETGSHLVRPAKPATGTSIEARDQGLPTAEQLLDADQIARLGLEQKWRVTRTHDNTSGKGINTICQQTRFADPDGISALVRTFEANGYPRRTAVQSVEISASARQAERAFATTVGWYAGCQVARLQLLEAYRVDGIGDQAQVLMVRVWKQPVTTYSVAVARIGRVTTSTIGETAGASPAPPSQISQSLADAVSMICGTSGSTGCAKQPAFIAVPPPPSGEEKGILAVADLPPVGSIDEPWVGTEPQPARDNPAATTCDHADFVKGGATRTRTRTFLIPQASLPDRFGLSETYGQFRSVRAAGRFLAEIRRKVAHCENRDLATKVSHARTVRRGETHMDLSTWDFKTEISNKESVLFRLGFVRVRNRVAELTFSPTARDDMVPAAFRDLVVRAGDRLRELG